MPMLKMLLNKSVYTLFHELKSYFNATYAASDTFQGTQNSDCLDNS